MADKAGLILVFGLFAGMFAGVGTYTFIYAKGYSYLGNDPKTCANCHVMQEKYDGWIKSPHHAIATCNDCHIPHDFIRKYAAKGRNGFWHSYYFTTGRFPDNIQITEYSRGIVEENCRRCHEAMLNDIDGVRGVNNRISCIKCHEDVGH